MKPVIDGNFNQEDWPRKVKQSAMLLKHQYEWKWTSSKL